MKHRQSFKSRRESYPVTQLQPYHRIAYELYPALLINLSWTSVFKEDLRCLTILGNLGQEIYLVHEAG